MDAATKMIGEKIRQHRKEKGLTQKELADKAGLSTMSIRRYENGDRVAPEKILKDIAAGLELPETFFLDERLPDIVMDDGDGTEVIIPGRIVRRIAACLEMNPYSLTPSMLRDADGLRKALDRVAGKWDKEYSEESGEVEFGDEMAETEKILRQLLDICVNHKRGVPAPDNRLETINSIFNSLNEEGRKKMEEYAMMLKYVPDYQRHRES